MRGWLVWVLMTTGCSSLAQLRVEQDDAASSADAAAKEASVEEAALDVGATDAFVADDASVRDDNDAAPSRERGTPAALDESFGASGVTIVPLAAPSASAVILAVGLDAAGAPTILSGYQASGRVSVHAHHVDAHGRVVRGDVELLAADSSPIEWMHGDYDAGSARFRMIAQIARPADAPPHQALMLFDAAAALTAPLRAQTLALVDGAGPWRVVADTDAPLLLRAATQVFALDPRTLAIDREWGVAGSIDVDGDCAHAAARDGGAYFACVLDRRTLSLRRIDAAGRIDASLGPGGAAVHTLPFVDALTGIELAAPVSDGLLVVLAARAPGGASMRFVLKLSLDGAWMPFGAPGINALMLPGAHEALGVRDLCVLDANRFALVLTRTSTPAESDVVVFGADGGADASYGEGGLLGRGTNAQKVLFERASGRILIIGDEPGALRIERRWL